MKDMGAGRRGGTKDRTAVIRTIGPPGVWRGRTRQAGEKVLELRTRDGRGTTIVQCADGRLLIHTDGLSDAHAVCIAADGSAQPIQYRRS